MGERKRIAIPSCGTVVTFTPREGGNPYDVYIIEGQMYSNGRISNFWTWKRVLDDGSLGEEESNYGNFTESENKYEITITAKKL
jgi:hypothetical protein